jgi:pimeloyl-ACP methyl ester carboxylesterase
MGTQNMVLRIAQHAVTEIGRIGSWRILRELPAATSMFMDSFLLARKTHERTDGSCVIFMPGFFAHYGYYLRLASWLTERGIRFVIPQDLRRNTLPWSEAHRILDETIKAEEDRTGIPPTLIGHSKGGTDILGMLADHPEIKRAIFVSSPLRGASLRALNLYLSLASGTASWPFDRDLLRDPAIIAKVSVVISEHDRVVPAHEAALDGAHTIKVEDLPSSDFWRCHTGLAYHVRAELHAIIASHTESYVA